MYEHMLKTGLIPKLTFSEYMDVDKAKLLEGTTVEGYKNKGYTILNKVKTGALGGSTLIWTFEKCCEEALKYEFRSEFQKKSNGAYDAAWNNRWLDKVCSHMKLKKKRDGYWSLERCKEEALKYSSCLEFDKKAPGAYKATKKNGWISEVCSHLKTRPRKNKQNPL